MTGRRDDPAAGRDSAAANRSATSPRVRCRQRPDLEVAQLHRPDRGPHQPGHRVPDLVQHPPHDVLASLVQDDLDQRRSGHARRPPGTRPPCAGPSSSSHARPSAPARPCAAAARPPRPGTSSPPRTTDGSAGAPGRRRWSAAAGPRCRCRAGRRGRPAAARRAEQSAMPARPRSSAIVETTPARLVQRQVDQPGVGDDPLAVDVDHRRWPGRPGRPARPRDRPR